MANSVEPAARQGIPVFHEVALIALGLGTSLAMVLAKPTALSVVIEVAGATSLYTVVLWFARGGKNPFHDRVRLWASMAFIVWFYAAVARITPHLGTTLRDGALLAADEALFGQTPAVVCSGMNAAPATDILIVCYLTYFVYLASAAIHATVATATFRQRLSAALFTAFAVGYAGYLVLPAVGPAAAFPKLFTHPLPSGELGGVLMEIVSNGSSRYDTFPSLHVLITCTLLANDWTALRSRFWIMILPALGMFYSTVYLRYHYAVDIVAGLLLFLALWGLRRWATRLESESAAKMVCAE